MNGLSSFEALARLKSYGPNELVARAPTSALRIFAAQFKGPMTALLLAACVLAAVLGETVDAVAIAAIVVLNGVVGFIQEFRAERAVFALRTLMAPRARVLRDGGSVIIAAREVVPGDILVLEAGDIVAADAKVLDAHALSANEATLTGESMPVGKSTLEVAAGTPLAEQTDRVFAGSSIATGTGNAEVFATGMSTELGKIAHLIESTGDDVTPLAKRLQQVTKTLLVVCVAIASVLALIAFLRGTPALAVVLSAVSLAVAAVPEGLPAVVTIALAIGVQRMASRHALVRRLPAVETLGCATVICTDKTGTLTTGVMSVRELWGKDHDRLLRHAAACSDAELSERGGIGDPTEVAILEAARLHGIEREEIERTCPRVQVNPFDSDRKRMSIFRSDGVLYLKGAVEVVLERCDQEKAGAAEMAQQLAARGLRVLAVARGATRAEEKLELVGLLGFADPPRSEAIEAIKRAHEAGIRTVMITGDHALTAQAIARELGISANDIHARATAGEKLEIVRALKRDGEIVAMTGDGVNDAPALREADIGIAMGKTGTEVTREAADIVLTDDNYASIVAAVEQGRGVYVNIQKALIFMLSGNAGELLVMVAASLAGLPLPLLPVHLLWINLITDGLPGLALVMDPAPADALSHPPRRPDEPMLGLKQWGSIAIIGLLEGSVTFAAFLWTLEHAGVAEARNIAFSVLVFSQLFRSLSFRSATRVYFETIPLSNLKLIAVVIVSVAVQLLIQQAPFARAIFEIEHVSWRHSAAALLLGLIPVTCLELAKLARRSETRAPSSRSAATA